jgi:RNA polymerase sigma-70 factor (ECF subfamily)
VRQTLRAHQAYRRRRYGGYAPAAPELHAAAEEAEQLRAAIAALPDDCRETLALYYSQKVTYHDLARQLGVSAATVNARLTQARLLVRTRLAEAAR